MYLFGSCLKGQVYTPHLPYQPKELKNITARSNDILKLQWLNDIAVATLLSVLKPLSL